MIGGNTIDTTPIREVHQPTVLPDEAPHHVTAGRAPSDSQEDTQTAEQNAGTSTF